MANPTLTVMQAALVNPSGPKIKQSGMNTDQRLVGKTGQSVGNTWMETNLANKKMILKKLMGSPLEKRIITTLFKKSNFYIKLNIIN